MAGETKRVYGSQTTLESSGAQVNSATMSSALTTAISTSVTGDYATVILVLTVTFAAAPTVMSLVEIYSQPLDIDGTTDAPAPTTTYLHEWVGAFVAKDTATQSLRAEVTVPKNCNLYLYNKSGQAMNSGWTVKATPVTDGPA